MATRTLIFTALLALGLLAGVWTAGAGEPAKELDGLPLLFHDDFESGMDKWEMTDDKAWRTTEDDGGKVAHLCRSSRYDPPVRSPHNMARVKDLDVGDFIMDVRCKQVGKEYGHRDLCFFYGYQDPAHFYYTHLATKADAHANSIFLVNDEPRVSIAEERTDGTDWGTGYHRVRIKRDAKSGRIEVYFDNMDKPVMVTTDKHFLSGTVGIGSFDDVGMFDYVTVWGKAPEAEAGGK